MDDTEELSLVVRVPDSGADDQAASSAGINSSSGDAATGGSSGAGDGSAVGTGGAAQDVQKIFIKVQQEGKKHPMKASISPGSTVESLVRVYCAKHELDPQCVVLQFDGLSMAPSKTLADYGIEDEDVIDAVVKKHA